MKILIASPVQQKPEILRMFLHTVQHVRKPEGAEVHYHFVDDNELEASSALLRRFQEEQPNVKIDRFPEHMRYVVDESTHHWTEDNMERVGRMKDAIIRAAIDGGFDYVWFIDSDLLVHPDTLLNLLQADKDIISCIFWTKWREDGEPMPQVWQSDQYSMVRARSPARWDKAKQAEEAAAFLEMLKKPGIYEVGGLGACTLIRRSALVRGVRFAYIDNLSMPGEDRHFCIRAKVLGFGLYVDTRTPAYHLYRSADLEGGYRFIKTHYGTDLRRIRVSLCVVVKDDEANLARCLRSAEGIADEIIVADAGASGRAAQVAAAFGAKVFPFDWNDDWSAARNYAFSLAAMDYILWLDPDDVIEPGERAKLLELLRNFPPDADAVLMDHHLRLTADGRPLCSRKRHRLVRRACGFRWEGAVNAMLEATGKVLHADIAITHAGTDRGDGRRMEMYARLLDRGAEPGPRDMLGYAMELANRGRHGDAITWFEKYLSSGSGWPEERAAACMMLAACRGAAGERDKQREALYRLFDWMGPRPEALCQLGMSFLEEGKYRQAAFWFEAAVRYRDERPEAGGWVDHSARTWLPYRMLAFCHDRLGDPGKARLYREAAERYQPDPSFRFTDVFTDADPGR